MSQHLQAYLQTRLDQQHASQCYRQRHIVNTPCSPRMHINGRDYLSFCSNDYLGLANHPAVVQALQTGASRYGVGSGAAHLISGHSQAHHELECALAEFTQREHALLFSTGYMANLGVATALLNRHATVFADKLNHASLIDAVQLSRAQSLRYAHNDMTQLAKQLAHNEATHKLIVSDAVFSMDGDLACLPELVHLAEQYNAWLMVDDAHGMGVLGAQGGGCAEHFNLNQAALPILMGTLGKALGTFGAFVAGSAVLIEALIQFARSYIYTTALPPSVAHATLTSLQLAQSETWRREKLHALIAYLQQKINQAGIVLNQSSTPIQPLIVGSAEQAVHLSQALWQQGMLVSAIRPPTVPQGQARLRITLSAAHEFADIDALVKALQSLRADLTDF